MAGSGGSPLTGADLLEIINSKNTKQVKFGSLEDIAAYIRELEIPAEIIMISLLQDVSSKLDCLNNILEEQKKTNKLLTKIYD